MDNETLDQTTSATTDAKTTDNTVGILAYCTLIGFIIAIVLNGDKQDETKKFGAFHLRQSLGLIIFAVGSMIVLTILMTMLAFVSLWLVVTIGGTIQLLFGLGILALAILGIVAAANGEKKPLPLIGAFIDKTLGSTFD